MARFEKHVKRQGNDVQALNRANASGRLGLESTFRFYGRPRKTIDDSQS